MKFEILVPLIRERLIKHHALYDSQCKAELWEETASNVLKESGLGSDWKPDYNHKIAKDIRTDSGLIISNKSGEYSTSHRTIKFSGSRSTEHETIEEKLDFFSRHMVDYVLCLSKDKKDWKRGSRHYRFVVIDGKKLNYHQQEWIDTFGQRGSLKNKKNGWKCANEVYSAEMRKKMSDQLWTTVELSHCKEIHGIIAR